MRKAFANVSGPAVSRSRRGAPGNGPTGNGRTGTGARGTGGTNDGMTADAVDEALRDQAERCLRALAGAQARLRDDQWTAIRALALERRRALVVQRTGWGKSAVYFVSTSLLRRRGAGPTVIVSPLLALMRNQVAAAQRRHPRSHDQLGQSRRMGADLH